MYEEPPIIQRPEMAPDSDFRGIDWRYVLTGLAAVGVLIIVYVGATARSMQDFQIGQAPTAAPLHVAIGPSATPSPKAEVTITPEPHEAASTPTWTATVIPSPTATATPMYSPTPSATLTPTPSATATPSPTPSATSTASPTHTPSLASVPCGIAPPSWGERSSWVAYVVQEGDNLLALAQDAGTTVAALLQANCLLDADSIRPGVTLLLPRALPVRTATPAASPTLPLIEMPIVVTPWSPPVYLPAPRAPFVFPAPPATRVPWPTPIPQPYPTPVPLPPSPVPVVTSYPTPAPAITVGPIPMPPVPFIPAPPPPDNDAPQPYVPPAPPPIVPQPAPLPPDSAPLPNTPPPGEPIGPVLVR